LRKENSLGRKLIEVGRLNDFVAVASEIAPSHVINEEDDDVRFLGEGWVALKKEYEGENWESHERVMLFCPCSTRV